MIEETSTHEHDTCRSDLRASWRSRVRVIRTMPDTGWAPLANTAAQDHRLSWRAKGLLLELISYPDGWDTSVKKLVDLGRLARKQGGHAEGRDAMYAAMEELVELGYVTYDRQRDKHGHWGTEITVTDGPNRLPENPESADQESVTQESGSQESETQVGTTKTTNKTDTKTDIERSSKQHGLSLASLAVTADAATERMTIQTRLETMWSLVDKLDHATLRSHLFQLENRRKKIYRDCRNSAIEQIKREDPKLLADHTAALRIDRLSFKYALQHYSPDWPMWLVRPPRMT